MANNKWSKEKTLKLHELKFKENKTNKEIAELLDKSQGSVQRKLKRMDWDSFLNNPDAYEGNLTSKAWTQAEMGLLYAYLEEKKSYGYIADKIGRSKISVERKAQTTDWKAWKAAVGDPEDLSHIQSSMDEATLTDQLVEALVVLSRREFDRLKTIEEKEFRRKVNFEVDPLPISYSKIRQKADEKLESLGLKNPEEVSMGEGTYVIVGDSHGKFTKNEMFDLLTKVNKFFNPKQFIHVGHLLDDDNDISYRWGKFKNLTILAKSEELHLIQESRNKFNFSFDVVRGCITLGKDLVVMNQDMITDYVKTPLGTLDSEIFDARSIVNCHRLELHPRCSNVEENGVSYTASPGCLCEPHIVRTIKQIDFEGNKTVKQANWEGFTKYRRMKHMCKYWKQGMVVVHVDKKGNATIVPCIINKLNKEYATSYFDKIISNKGIFNPDKKIFITADGHSPNHRNEVLDVQDQIAKDYKPDIFINLGDSADYRMLNHHILDRGGVIFGDILYDGAATYKVLNKQYSWAKKCYVQVGNHERFGLDFVEKFPQLKELLKFEFLCAVNEIGYDVISLKKKLQIGDVSFIHGDLKFFGQSGSKVEKASKTFKNYTYMGDSHHCAIRYGTFVVGMTGELNQEYNEITATTWCHGLGLCNQYKGKSWPTTIQIINDRCILKSNNYVPKNPDEWSMKNYKAKIVYEEI